MKTAKKIISQRFKVTKVSRLMRSVLLGGFICVAFVSFSATMPVSSPGNDETEKVIRNYFRFPQVLLPHSAPAKVASQKVEVLFTTDRFGRVNFALAKTDDGLLKQEVEKQFYRLSLPKLRTEVVHSVVLNFKTL